MKASGVISFLNTTNTMMQTLAKKKNICSPSFTFLHERAPRDLLQLRFTCSDAIPFAPYNLLKSAAVFCVCEFGSYRNLTRVLFCGSCIRVRTQLRDTNEFRFYLSHFKHSA